MLNETQVLRKAACFGQPPAFLRFCNEVQRHEALFPAASERDLIKRHPRQTPQADDLRQRAEKLLQERRDESDLPESDLDTGRLLHELQVHQVELESQNEELIRARAEAEAALAKYTDLYDYAPVGYLTLDRHGVILSVNFIGATLLGHEPALLLGRSFRTSVAAESRSTLTAFLKQAFSGAPIATCDVTIPRESGPPCIARITASALGTGQECRMVIMDITMFKGDQAVHAGMLSNLERVVAARTADLADVTVRLQKDIMQRQLDAVALSESEERYRRLLASITDYVFRVDLTSGDVMHTEHGEGCEAVTGYTPEEYDRSKLLWVTMIPFEDRPTVTDAMKRIMTSSSPITVEHRIIHKDGQFRWISNTLVPHRNSQGELTSYDGIIADITERKLHEEERYRLEQEALRGEKLRALGQLATGVAHEVRSPLNAIIVTAELLMDHLKEKPECRTYLERIRRQVARLDNLMKDLLELRRPPDAKNRQHVGVTDMCQKAIDTWAQSRTEMQHRLVAEFMPEAEHAKIHVDPDRMLQVVVNILDNAAQQSAAETEIRVSVYGSGGGFVTLQVHDQGTGLSKKSLEHAFDPWFTTRKGGSGLGLSIVKHIVETYGGQITIGNNEPPPGCTVKIRLPIAEQKRT